MDEATERPKHAKFEGRAGGLKIPSFSSKIVV